MTTTQSPLLEINLNASDIESLEDIVNNFIMDIALQTSLNEYEENIPAPKSITIEQIDSICPLTYIEQKTECSICLKNVEVGSKMRELPCGHTFCKRCIDPWFTNNSHTCPSCRKYIEF